MPRESIPGGGFLPIAALQHHRQARAHPAELPLTARAHCG